MLAAVWSLTFMLVGGTAPTSGNAGPQYKAVVGDPDGPFGQVVLNDGSVAGGSDPCESEPLGGYGIAFSFPNRFRGDLLEMGAQTTLRRFAMELDFIAPPTNLTFWVLRYDPDLQTYALVRSVTVSTVGGGRDFYWSSEFAPPVTLAAANRYVLAVSWGNVNIAYGRDDLVYPQPFSDGTILGSVAATAPITPPIGLSTFTNGAYSMKLCTDPRPGACCVPDTHQCVNNVLATECEQGLGGFFSGEGTTCLGVPCVFGACCRLTGLCLPDYTASACADVPGIWHENAVCGEVQCEVLAGACCVANQCVPEATAAACATMGGSFRGAGTLCETIEPACGRGACCSTVFGCFDTTPANCSSLPHSSFFNGDGTTCDQIDPCPGLCCAGATHNSCVSERTPAECNDLPGGVFIGYGSEFCGANTCTNVGTTGACCLTSGGCALTSANGCTAVGGTFSAGVACANAPCAPRGACCRLDGTCQANATEADCLSINGTYHGDDSLCTPNPCPPPAPGACCAASGACTLVLPAQCAAAQGEFQGAGTDCSPNPCPQPTGACCLLTGACSPDKTTTECANLSGSYQGDGTDCEPNECPQPTGACCLASGACESHTQQECTGLGGTFEGIGIPCTPGLCPQPTGACCLAGGTCDELTEQACADVSGSFEGVGTSCTPNPCAPPTGACCLAGGVCEVHSASDCDLAGGTYQGDDAVCDPNPCGTVISIVSSAPADGTIDARQPALLEPDQGNGCPNPQGLTTIELTFDDSTAGLIAGDFALTTEPDGVAPGIASVTPAGNSASVVLDSRIPPGKWTRITHTPSGTSVRIGYLPGDVNADRTTSPVDILKIIDALNGAFQPPFGIMSTDIDRSGVTNPADVLRVIDLLNGADCYDSWNGATLPL